MVFIKKQSADSRLLLQYGKLRVAVITARPMHLYRISDKKY